MRPVWANHLKFNCMFFTRRHTTKHGRLPSWLILFRCTCFTMAGFALSGVTEKGLYLAEKAISTWLFMPLFCTYCIYLVVFPREFLGAHHCVMHVTRRCIPSADELCRTAGGSSCWTSTFSLSREANGPSLFAETCSCAHSFYDWQVLYQCGHLLMKENRIPLHHPSKLPQKVDEHFVFSSNFSKDRVIINLIANVCIY